MKKEMEREVKNKQMKISLKMLTITIALLWVVSIIITITTITTINTAQATHDDILEAARLAHKDVIITVNSSDPNTKLRIESNVTAGDVGKALAEKFIENTINEPLRQEGYRAALSEAIFGNTTAADKWGLTTKQMENALTFNGPENAQQYLRDLGSLHEGNSNRNNVTCTSDSPFCEWYNEGGAD